MCELLKVIAFLLFLTLAIDKSYSQVSFVKDVYPKEIVDVNGTAFFIVNEGPPHGIELWKSDGTEAGTVMVKDLGRSRLIEGPDELTNVNGTLFFSYNDGTHGKELWKSDGTEAGTVMVKDIYTVSKYPVSDPLSSNPSDFVVYQDKLFFSASDGNGNHGKELWKSDGTEAGTVIVKDINKGEAGSSPSYLVNFKGFIYFSAQGNLWKSDGTEAGTKLLRDIKPNGGSRLSNLYVADDILFFYGNDFIRGNELWKSDGTKAGTRFVKDINPGSSSSVLALPLASINGILYFSANDGIHGEELWKSDGTEAGTVMVKDIYPGERLPSYGNSSGPNALTVVNGTLFFVAEDGVHGEELWKSDGTEAGTAIVKDIRPGNSLSEYTNELVNLNGTLVFAPIENTHGKELWKSDGTEVGTVMVKDIYPGNNSSGPSSLTNINGTLFFSAKHFINTGLWQYDPNASPCNEPEPTFSASASVCFGDNVAFTDNSTNVYPGATYLWNFGDGDTSSVVGSVSHVYDSIANNDGFTISLTISQGGCSKTFFQTVKVHPEVYLDPFMAVSDTADAFVLDGGYPAGGVFSGEGVSNGMFNPSAVGSGAYEITYTYTDTASCSNSATQTIKVKSSTQPEAVVSFTLVNANTNKDIMELTDGMEIYAHELPIARLSIRSNTNSSIIGSVFMALRGNRYVKRTENIAPYALYGDENGNYQGEYFEADNYSINAVPYYNAYLDGGKGQGLRINFSIVEQEEPISLVLVNTATQEDLFQLNDQGTVDLSEVGVNLGIRAEVATNGNVLQTRFELSGEGYHHVQYEGEIQPISVFGDRGVVINPWPMKKLKEGWYSLSAQSSVNKKNKIEALNRTIAFSIVAGQAQSLRTSNTNTKVFNAHEKEFLLQYDDLVEVYPNPFTKDIKIQMPGSSSESIDLQLVDLYGRTMFLKNVKTTAGEATFSLEEANIAAGTYILKVNWRDYVEMIKVIKQN